MLSELFLDHYGPKTSPNYDSFMPKIFWFYRESIDAAVAEIIYARRHQIRKVDSILELGMGTGEFSLTLVDELAAHQNSAREVFGVDTSDHMLEVARQKLEGRVPSVTIQNSDLFHFDQVAQGKRFDAVIGSYSIHHLSDDDKKVLYRKVFDALNPGGLFVMVDRIIPEQHDSRPFSPQDFGGYMTAMMSRMRKFFNDQGKAISEQDLMRSLKEETDRDNDQPTTLSRAVGDLTAVGFSGVRVPFLAFCCSVVSGVKPSEVIQ